MFYLILHKVRGEPAFDIATRLDPIDGIKEEIWIIPTSGHRCYPYAMLPLSELEASGLDRGFFDTYTWQLPNDWPDHYQTQAELQRHPKITIEDLLI